MQGICSQFVGNVARSGLCQALELVTHIVNSRLPLITNRKFFQWLKVTLSGRMVRPRRVSYTHKAPMTLSSLAIP